MSSVKNEVVIRFFYAPLCPEVFATVDRLVESFYQYNGVIFETYNVAEGKFRSDRPFLQKEQEIIQSVLDKGNTPLSYGKLFVNGEEVKGFPPARKSIEELLEKNGLEAAESLYSNDYKSTNFHDRNRFPFSEGGFHFLGYEEKLPVDLCKVCTKYNPYMSLDEYDEARWERFEKEKRNYIHQLVLNGEMIGQSAVYEQETIGFIEAMAVNLARKHGFTPVELPRSIFITCLSVAKEASGKRVAYRLLERLIENAKQKGYEAILVHAHPNEQNWHPISLYEKFGFQKTSKGNKLIMIKTVKERTPM